MQYGGAMWASAPTEQHRHPRRPDETFFVLYSASYRYMPHQLGISSPSVTVSRAA